MEARELIKKIFDICQNTPEFDAKKNHELEAGRLDVSITKINTLCDEFLYDVKNKDNE